MGSKRPALRVERRRRLSGRRYLGVRLGAFSAYGWHLRAAQGIAQRQAAEIQMTRCIPIPAPRGIITDRHRTPLAANVSEKEVVAGPALLLNRPEAVARLADLLTQPAPELHRTLATADEHFVRLRVVRRRPEAASPPASRR